MATLNALGMIETKVSRSGRSGEPVVKFANVTLVGKEHIGGGLANSDGKRRRRSG